MKILQINKFYYPRGGTETYMFRLSDLLERAGHSVIPFSMKDGKNRESRFADYFVDEVRLDKFSPKNILKFFYNRQAVRNLKRLIAEERPDLAHLHNIAHQLTPAIIKVLKKAGIPIVQTLHDYKLICPNYRLFENGEFCERCKPTRASGGGRYWQCLANRCIDGSYPRSLLATLEAYWYNRILRAYDLVDLFIAPSRFMKDICVRFGVDKDRIKIVYHFVEAPVAGGESFDNGLSSEPYLLYFGRLSEEKGLGILIDALTKSSSGFNLKIIGAGPDRLNLKYKIENLKLNDRVEVLDPIYGYTLEKMIRDASAVVIPSIWPENQPLSALEAMALGKPLIASDIGGLSELIVDGENGMLVRPGSVEDLAAAIGRLERLDLKAAGAKSKEFAAQLTAEKHLKEILKIYQEAKHEI